MKYVLASSSPRRQELLSMMGYEFTTQIPDIVEKPRKGETPKQYVRRNAFEKAQAVYRKLAKNNDGDCVIISADTIVVLKNKILEKPISQQHAAQMLAALSGKTHRVYTGLCVLKASTKGCQLLGADVVRTKVTLRKLSRQEIAAYIKTKEPMDKAGAYAAQGRGGTFIKRIEGSFTNVIGLPTVSLQRILTK